MSRKGSLLGLLLVNREDLVGEVVIGRHLGHSDHEIVEFRIFGDRRKTARKCLTLNKGRQIFGLLRELRSPGILLLKALGSINAVHF